MSFAWNLKKLRSEMDLTQGELAGKIGVSQKTLSSWETGRTEPNIGEVIAICNTLGCTMEKITGIRSHDINDVTFEDLIAKMRSLSLKELSDLHREMERIADEKKRIDEMERERRMYLERIAQYEAEISKLKQHVHDHFGELEDRNNG